MQRFIASLAKGVFTIARCKSCSSVVWPPNPVCRICLGMDMEWVDMYPARDEIRGRIVMVSESHIRKARFALIELENGIRLFGRIMDDDKDLCTGSPVLMVGCGIEGDEPYYVFKSFQASTSNT
ncbi:MAG: zinc ribbon domain-containing protein [Candidatus Nitrosocaldus sp.]|nr:zinc ribbon domain-containing protein [Candidatus Nitrosocaldus sp.]MCS7141135.1 zinc ribbon domain-containing protein [Candidatus Nitrosocaldus sp.]MDW8000099.1 zinc ribbon domain-containing protein [Candidatus Nitrosocaldus sp.]MDW8275557.1 zinc ribbon domain-containing protein [Candidatus Nitrosocaldus sp.]